MDRKVFALGEADAVLGFSLIGIDGLATDEPDTALATLAELRRNPDMGLILVTATLASRIRPALEEAMFEASLPLIYEIPDRLGRPAGPPLSEVLRRALGVYV
jgi:vacuolar-type H+-ATPase subunit F/Vma7